jgi:ATP-binding cassette, subfamily B, bacterial PglK
VNAAFRELYAFMSPRRRRHLFATAALVVLAAAAELVMIAAVVPFLAVVSEADTRWDISPEAATGMLVAAAIFAGIVRLALARVSQQFVMSLGHELGTAIFSGMLRRPYAYYSTHESSELVSGLEKVQTIVYRVLLPSVQGSIAAVIAFCIIVLLFVIDTVAAAAAAFCATAIYLGVSLYARRRLQVNSVVLAETATARTKAVQEGLGGIRDILLERSQGVFEEDFRKLDLRYRNAEALNLWTSIAPRYVVETAGIVIIGGIALVMSTRPGGLEEALPTLAALTLGAQRLLPLLQMTYLSWSQSVGNLGSLLDVLTLLEAPEEADDDAPPPEPMPFTTAITFDHVGFRYPRGDEALGDVTLEIGKGQRVGIVGTTGAGKSTLVDLLLGLLEPTSGEIRIDGTLLHAGNRAAWQRHIAHVPQFIHLASDTVAANIAFGVAADAIDHERVREAARQAHVDDFIESLPDGYQTKVGERGARLSGGQRQRIGIARALYKRAAVLIFDEATGALDRRTEEAVLRSISALGREITVVMIAHSDTALADCDRVFRLQWGRVASEAPGSASASS